LTVPDRTASRRRTSPAAAWLVVGAVAAASGVTQSFGRFTYSLLFTDLRDDFAISNTVAGALGSANLGAYLLGSLVVSVAVGRLGLANTLRGGIVGSCCSLVVLAWSPSLGVTFAAMTVAGFCGAFVWITAPGLATAALGAQRRGLAIGVSGAGIGIGIVVASIMATVVASTRWRLIYAMEAALAVLVVGAVLVIVRPSRRTPTRDRADTGAGEAQPPAGLSTVREIPGWVGLMVAYALFAFGMALVMTFTVAVLVEQAGWTRPGAALAFTTIGLGTVAGGPVFGPLSDRFGRSPMLVVAFVVQALTGLLLPLGLRPWTVGIAFAFGMAFTGVPTVIAARVSDQVSDERFGAAFGAATLAFGVGLLAGPQFGGFLADATGSFQPGFVVVAGCAIMGAAIGLTQPR
jgi:predicted MFS family arabinose efflux permease